jgi:hypothetical protein
MDQEENMSQEINNELVKIIELLGHEPEPEQKSKYLDDEYLQELKEKIKNLQTPVDTGKMVDILREDIKNSEDRYRYREPYLKIFLSYAYIVANINTEAMSYAGKTHEYDWDNKWDYALSRWFLGIVYLKNNLCQEARNELTDAQNKLEQYCTDAQKRHKDKRANKCNEVIKLIKDTIENLPKRTPQSSLSMAAGPGYTPPGNKDPIKEKNEKNQKDGTPPMNINIRIPVDIRSTDNFDQVSVQKQHNRQNLESAQTDNSRSDIDLLSWLWFSPSLPRVNRSALLGSEIPPQNIDEIKDLFDLSYIVTPSFPLYGRASAGPNGWPVLDEPDYSAAIDETSLIQLEGKEHRIYSEKKGDKQISISTSDFLTSIFPPRISERFKLNGKRFGWLKVIGNSMNNASPTPIESGDYVLFYKNNDMNSCINQIVVAAVPNFGSDAPRLAIKRLIKLVDSSNENGNDKTKAKPAEKFYLHSESLFDIDPDTGENYGIDLELVDDNQIIGVVIAVASTKQKQII